MNKRTLPVRDFEQDVRKTEIRNCIRSLVTYLPLEKWGTMDSVSWGISVVAYIMGYSGERVSQIHYNHADYNISDTAYRKFLSFYNELREV